MVHPDTDGGAVGFPSANTADFAWINGQDQKENAGKYTQKTGITSNLDWLVFKAYNTIFFTLFI